MRRARTDPSDGATKVSSAHAMAPPPLSALRSWSSVSGAAVDARRSPATCTILSGGERVGGGGEEAPRPLLSEDVLLAGLPLCDPVDVAAGEQRTARRHVLLNALGARASPPPPRTPPPARLHLALAALAVLVRVVPATAAPAPHAPCPSDRPSLPRAPPRPPPHWRRRRLEHAQAEVGAAAARLQHVALVEDRRTRAAQRCAVAATAARARSSV